jgi:catechol 2,3-dioxygenase-like lactoylglutathione lyase family enzyme
VPGTKLRMAGVELYFDDLDRARKFYRETLGLRVTDEAAGQFVQFDAGSGFVCLERKGSENYPSQDKAVLFFEVPDVARAIGALGRERIVGLDLSGEARAKWAVVHDPEGHNILLLESRKPRKRKPARLRRRAR